MELALSFSVLVKTEGLIIAIRWKVVAPSQEIGTYQTFHVLVYLVDSSGYSSFLRLKSFIKLNKSNNVVSFFPRRQLSLPRFSPYLRKMPKECSTIFSPKDRSNRLGKKSQWLIMTTIDVDLYFKALLGQLWRYWGQLKTMGLIPATCKQFKCMYCNFANCVLFVLSGTGSSPWR